MKKKRVVILAILLLAMAGYFWTQSRYPALNEKALMGGRVETQGLSFGVVYEITPEMSLVRRVLYSTINWVYTNKQGMTFAIFFGSAVLTFLKLVHWQGRKNVFLNSVKGVVSGTPLGVCANCVAPIGKGMYDAGTRVETVLSAMISSPTMNVVVLTMLFSLFSYDFALIKLLMTVFFVLIVIPFATRVFFTKENARANEVMNTLKGKSENAFNETWFIAFKEAIKAYLKDLWYIIKLTVPFMLLAGFLGALFIEIIPLHYFLRLEDNVFIAAAMAFIAGILPVPMTFDVIVAFSLHSAGLSTKLTMIFLFASGTFSIYPFLVLWKTISKRVAISMMLGTMIFALIAGYLAQWYEDYQIDQALNTIDAYFEES